MENIAAIRTDYKLETLSEADTDQDALVQFAKWWDQAVASTIDEVNAMTLSTVNEHNRPSARIVLLKGFNDGGFVFYTNYESNKGHDLSQNPNCSLVFFWKELQRQVRIEGMATKVTEAESDQYFHSRPVASQLGAWASPQSRKIESRSVLEQSEADYELKFKGAKIPRPPHWGGYIVKPSMVEFWQGRTGRLHDRIRYTLNIPGNEGEIKPGWTKERLAP